MPQTTSSSPENELVTEIIKLNRTLRKANSAWRALLRGMLTAVGTMIGVILLTAALGVFIFQAAQDVNWDEVVQSAVMRAIGGGNSNRR